MTEIIVLSSLCPRLSEVEEPTRRRLNQRVVATGDRHRTLSGSSRRLNEAERQFRPSRRRQKMADVDRICRSIGTEKTEARPETGELYSTTPSKIPEVRF